MQKKPYTFGRRSVKEIPRLWTGNVAFGMLWLSS